MKKAVPILFIFFLANISNRLFACSCKEQKTVVAEVKYSDAVFVGTIVAKKIVTIGNTSASYTTVARYDLTVEHVYKGKITNDTLTIFTGLSAADCGVFFEIGKKYVVYGKNETYFHGDFKYPKAQNTFWTNNCFWTMIYKQNEINEIKKHIKMLN